MEQTRQYLVAPHSMSEQELLRHAVIGIAAQRAGWQEAILYLQTGLDRLGDSMGALQARIRELEEAPRVTPKRIAAGRHGWPATAEARSKEMKRRQALARKKLRLNGAAA